MKAIIVAAGRALRMHPIADGIPKARDLKNKDYTVTVVIGMLIITSG